MTSTPIGAAAGGRLELVEYLLEKGANPNVVDEKGATLLGVAQAKLAEYKDKKWDSKHQEGIVNALEAALQKSPDGKGQNGDEAVRANPEQDRKRSH